MHSKAPMKRRMKSTLNTLIQSLQSCLLVYLLLFSNPQLLAQSDELLPPEQAFGLVAWMEGDRLIAEYDIAQGYYMYRQRFDFQIESGNARFDTAIMPDGKIKNDEFFGDMEVYRGKLRIVLPVLPSKQQTLNLIVKATGQGCADIGVCYPPLSQTLNVNTASSARIIPTAYLARASLTSNEDSKNVSALQALLSDITENPRQNDATEITTVSSDSKALELLQSLGASFGLSDGDDIPHPDTAFVLSAKLDSNNIIQSEIELYPKTYLYKDKFNFEIISGTGHTLGTIAMPDGDIKDDEFFGRMEVYHERIKVSIPIISETGASDQFTLVYGYQGCVEDRICYPPISKYLQVNTRTGTVDISDQPAQMASLDTAGSNSLPNVSAAINPAPTNDTQPVSEQGKFTQLLLNGNILIAIGLFFLAGIGLTFTPCVFPMIPILSGIIAGQGESITTRKAFSLSLVYVLAMATTYAIIGAIVGYYGAKFNIQIWFQDPWVLSSFAAVFVLLALSMFGFYEIRMPSAFQSRIIALSNSQQGGTLIGVGLMGSFSALIVGPCITAPLVGVLIFISQTQDWLLGALALFTLGLGMGVPLLLVGTSAGKLLPHAGLWMDRVKAVFGVVMLAFAIWLLERFLPADIIMLLIAVLVITSAIYMGALDSLPDSVSGWRKLIKGIGVIFLIYGTAYLIGAASGSKDLVQPLKGIVTSSATGSASSGQENRIIFRQIKGVQGLQQALANSVQINQPTMLDFYAEWCISCKVMEKYAFAHPGVLAALDRVATLQADVTDNDAIDTELMNSLGIYGPPAILFYDSSGKEIRSRRVVGEMSGEDFAAHIIATLQ
jgi:thiol:disulfide interchange protein DsbD